MKGHKILDAYQAAHQAVYDYFGYEEGWVVLPFDDCRSYYWQLVGDTVHFADDKESIGPDGATYSDEVYRGRHIEKPVIRKKDLTLIAVNTHTDGNKFLAIYDNAKEVK